MFSSRSQDVNCEEVEARLLLEENEKLRDEIRKLAIASELDLSCSNTSCLIETSTNSSNHTLTSDTDNTYIMEKKISRRNPIRCIMDHPSRLRIREEDMINFTDDKNAEVSDVDCRIIGEIALQLDRRILQFVFAPRKRLYGFTVRNIREKIEECCTDVVEGGIDSEARKNFIEKYDSLIAYLYSKSGYHELYHAIFSEILINTFGVLRKKSRKLMDFDDLNLLINRCLKKCYARETAIILNALAALAKIEGKALFV